MVMASLENSLGSIGGFCVGTNFIVDHQRLSGLGEFCASNGAICIMFKLRQQDSVKQQIYQSWNFDSLWGVRNGNILTIRQADYILPTLGSTRNYLTRHCNQLAAPKIKLNYDRFLEKIYICRYKIF